MSEEKNLFDAYVFAFPLVIMDMTMRHMTNVVEPVQTRAPVGMIGHSTILANADSKFVVTPNVDTLYSIAYMDLSKCSYVLDVPKADRYVSYELLNAYTDCVAVLGSGMTVDHGRFFIRGPGNNDTVPKDCTLVPISTSIVWMIVRTICTDPKDASEMKEIDSIRNKIKITPVSGEAPKKGVQDPKYDFIPVKYVVGMDVAEFFSLFNELSKTNPPSEADAPFMKKIASLGIGPGLDFDPDKLSDEGKASLKGMGKKFVEAMAVSKKDYQYDVNGWRYWDDRMARYGTEYNYRALIALGGLGANPMDMAIYPFCEYDSEGRHLDGKYSYKMHLDRTPPVKDWGFWSFTLYGDDDFLVANPIDRYCINDRSDVKYNHDGSLDVMISEKEPKSGNWLPCGSKGFHFVLRVYLPKDEVMNGSWVPPSIVRI